MYERTNSRHCDGTHGEEEYDEDYWRGQWEMAREMEKYLLRNSRRW